MSEFKRITESESHYDHLEQKSVREILEDMNREDLTVPHAVHRCIPEIENFVSQVALKMQEGGRLFYIGAGTSGRLGILDASECPPTFGVPHDLVIALMAGGDGAIRRAVEFAEDDEHSAWIEIQKFHPEPLDSVLGIAASGTTPYVLGGIREANAHGLITGGLCCNPGSPLSLVARYPIVCVPGPEYLTGSTRLKSGTAQKLILNMISTSLMIQLGRVQGNKMVDMALSNHKLIDRGVRMIVEESGIGSEEARKFLLEQGSVRAVLEYLKRD